MIASNYYEAFLSVYGWELYRLLYFMLGGVGFFLYPLARVVIELFTDELAGDGRKSADNQLRRTGVTVGMMLALFAFAMVPAIPLSFDKMQVKTPCITQSVSQANNSGNKPYMLDTETHVPIMPYLAMTLGQSINGLFYKTLPCVMDKTEAVKAAYAVDFGENPEGSELRAEYTRFRRECQSKISRVSREILDGRYNQGFVITQGGSNSQWFKDKLKEAIRSEPGVGLSVSDSEFEKYASAYMQRPDSKLVQELFLDPSGSQLNQRPGLQDIVAALKADHPVDGYPGGNPPDAQVPPSCAQWWRGSGGVAGLDKRIAVSLEDDYLLKVAKQHGPAACRPTTNPYGPSGYQGSIPGGSPTSGFPTNMTIDISDREGCLLAAKQALASGNDAAFETALFDGMAGKQETDGPMGGDESLKLTSAISVAVIANFIPVVKDLGIGQGILGSIAGFYATIFMLKLLLKFILPFIMMTIYAFWGVMMTVGAFQGRIMVKGMILIAALTVIPGLWHINEHLDDKLFDALFDDENWLKRPLQMLMLDLASSVFYIGIVFVLFYIIQLAGEGDAGGTLKGGQEHTNRLSRDLGVGALKTRRFSGKSGETMAGWRSKATGFFRKG